MKPSTIISSISNRVSSPTIFKVTTSLYPHKVTQVAHRLLWHRDRSWNHDGLRRRPRAIRAVRLPLELNASRPPLPRHFWPGFVSPIVGWLLDKYGVKWPVTAGLVVTMPTLICLRFVADDTVQHKMLLGFLLAILGAALTFCATPLMAEIGYVISAMDEQNPGIFGEKGVYGLGYGLFTMAFALGGVVGPLWAGYVHDGPGWGTMTWTFGLWSASAMVVVLICPGSRGSRNIVVGAGFKRGGGTNTY